MSIAPPTRDVGVGEAGGFEASGGGFGDGSCGAGGVAGVDFDEFFVDVVGELFFGVGAGGLGASGGGVGDRRREKAMRASDDYARRFEIHARHCFMAMAAARNRDCAQNLDER